MQTINLSKLVMSPYFFNLLDQENLGFDQVFTDNQHLAKAGNIPCIDEDLASFFHKQEKLKT